MKEDKNIERFFKKRLESNDFSYQEKDWEDLEQKLDAAGMFPTGNGLSPVKLIVAGLIISMGGFFLGWFLRDQVQESPIPQENSLVERELKPATNESEHSGSNPKADKAYLDSKRVDPTSDPVVDPQGHGSSVNSDVYRKNPPSEKQARKNDRALSVLENDSPDEHKTGGFMEFRELENIRVGMIANELSGQKRNIPVLIEEQKEESVNPEKSDFKDRWSVGLSVAPDLNSVGLTERKSFSPKFGAQVYYSLTKRWTISTGVHYNKKKYTTDVEGYSPPEGYWYYGTNGIKPSNIIGACGVVDIPVKVYYRWTGKHRFHFYFSLGVSNYFLLDESYEFEFDQPNPGSADGWYTEENSSIIAGVGNISALMSYRVSEKSDLFVEPYLQAPLTKMGWGQVDLFSTGLLFTFRYKLFRPPGIDGKP